MQTNQPNHSDSYSEELDTRLNEILVGFAERYPDYQDYVKLGDKQAVANLLNEAKTALQTLINQAKVEAYDRGYYRGRKDQRGQDG